VTVQAAQIRTYKVLPAGAGLMLPALDSQGNVWFGEMATNQLARLNAHTGVITAWVPPLGKYGIMAVTIDVQGNIWFAEQNANYIGRFTPTKQTFRIFPLGMVNGHAMGPEDLQFDASGKLWFTGVTSGQIGRLDPATGAIQMWPVPAPAANVQPYPYGLAVTAKGQIWFGSTSGGVVGHLDPMANRVTLYPLANSQEQIYSMATDTQGRIWFTELAFGVLGMIDTASGKVTELKVPTTLGNPEDLHSIAVSNGKVWFTSSGTNALVRYSPDDATYTFFQLPVPASVPFGLACDSKGKLWFTAAAEPVNYVGEMTP
jgi:virginiamycin B lyase